MENKNGVNEKIHSLFQVPENREAFSLLYKLLLESSKGLCLCQVHPKERLKILEFFDDDLLNERIYIVDMVNPLRGPMELQQTIIDVNSKFGVGKDIFFIYNIEECINLLKKSAEKFFREMNLIRDFFMPFDAVFVFFLTESSVKVMIKNAFDFYDWMKFTFIFTGETGDLLPRPTGVGEREVEKYSAPLEKIKYLENSIYSVENVKAMSIQLLELAQLYSQMSDYDKALERLEESLEIEKMDEDLDSMAIRYNEIGLIHKTKGDLDAALMSFNKALEIYKKKNDRVNMEPVQSHIDEIKRLMKDKKKLVPAPKPPGAIVSDAFNWDELLERIRRKNVIPVIGHGLYRVETEQEGGKEVLLYDYLADRMSELFKFTLDPDENHRFAKACTWFLKKLDKNYMYLSNFLKETMKGIRLIPAGSLWKLARIKAFNIYITTAYDNFLTKTLNVVRSNPTKALGYTVAEKKLTLLNHDLFDSLRDPWNSLVYQIFGSMEDNFTPAYTEKDILESLLEFNSDIGGHRENYLFQELRVSSPLFMGCGYDDWLYRLFIRVIANESYEFPGRNRLSRKYVVDDFNGFKQGTSDELLRFLDDYDTGIFHTGNAGDFVDILFDKLKTAYPEEIIQPMDFPGTVFISFDGRDRPAAKQLAENLQEDGTDVWWDERDMEAGDSIDLTIMKAIDKCRVFIPLVSENSKSMLSPDGELKYHIQEWHRAISNNNFGKNVTIIPVVIDGTKWVYSKFKDTFHLNLPGGEKAGDYDRLKEMLTEAKDKDSG